MSTEVIPALPRPLARGIPAASRFYLFSSALLLLLVLVGFSRTFFLRPFFDLPPLAASLYVHGALLSAWFALVFVQACLVGRGRIATHRRVGIAAALYAAIVVGSGIHVNLRKLSELESAQDAMNVILWGNFFTLLVFAGFVSTAILLRRRPEAHRRLMLLASIAIIGPALGRIPTWPLFAGSLDAARNFAIGGSVLLLISMIAHDLISRRALHPATWIGSLTILVSSGAAVALGLSPAGFEILRALH